LANTRRSQSLADPPGNFLGLVLVSHYAGVIPESPPASSPSGPFSALDVTAASLKRQAAVWMED